MTRRCRRNWTFMPIPGMFYLLLFVASNSRLTADENTAPTETLSNKPGFFDLLGTFLNGSTPLLIVVLFAMISGFYVIPKRVGVWPTRFLRKNFLRMHVTKEKITVYTIGIDKIS
jgi:hypothetical protein